MFGFSVDFTNIKILEISSKIPDLGAFLFIRCFDSVEPKVSPENCEPKQGHSHHSSVGLCSANGLRLLWPGSQTVQASLQSHSLLSDTTCLGL